MDIIHSDGQVETVTPNVNPGLTEAALCVALRAGRYRIVIRCGMEAVWQREVTILPGRTNRINVNHCS